MLKHDIRGSGAHTVFLLHGFLGSGRNLVSLARLWSEREPRLRLILPDLTGHGQSPHLQKPATLDQVADDMFALATSTKADEPLTIVGHSFGGRAALAMRLMDPSRVGRIVLLDIAPSPIDADLGGLDNVLKHVLTAPATVPHRDVMRVHFTEHGISAPLTEWVLLNLVQEGEQLRWRFDREALKDLHAQSRTLDLWAAVEAPGVQTTLIHGARSRFVSQQDVERFQDAAGDVITIPDAGHFLHVDALSALLDALVGLSL